MQKLIFCNLDLLKSIIEENDYEDYDFSGFDYNLLRSNRDKFIVAFNVLANEAGNKIYFYSRKRDVLKRYETEFKKHGYNKFQFKNRDVIQNFVKSNKGKNNYFVFISSKNVDFTLAVNTKALFIVPEWLPLQNKTERYGIHVQNVKQLQKFIQTLNNQNVWYSRLLIDDISVAYSLVDARYGVYAKNNEERTMVLNFQKLLKNSESLNYRRILLYHFLAGITGNMDFDDIELFGVIPSSNCEVNKYVFDFMTQVRLLKGKKLPKNYSPEVLDVNRNLIIRHTEKEQNHNGGRNRQERINLGAKDEFKTLMINPDYKRRIKTLKENNKLNICIFDDYMTHGNSFNAVRNLLESIGANKIIFVSIGIFMNPFQKRDYTISGNVYGKNYDYVPFSYQMLNNYEINDNAKKEVAELYEIFSS